ncbi:MAG: hypothetical protein IJK23_06515 [Clostridia bacterium]|nr:hypothetical protein [Clostridia bacterium]
MNVMFSSSGQEDSTPNRLWTALFGSFTLFGLALRQQSGVLRTQNSSKISRPKVQSSFSEADFFQDNEAAADNTSVLSRLLRQDWRKYALKNRFGADSPCPNRAPQKARLIVVVFSDPDRFGMRRLHFPDGGVQIFIPASDLELVVALLKKQMRFLFRSRHFFTSLRKDFSAPPFSGIFQRN